MAEPTKTRADIRRKVGRRLGMKFYQKYAPGYIDFTSDQASGCLTLGSPKLTQANDYWNNDWAWIGTTAQERSITDFSATGDLLTLEYALASAPGTSDYFEITSIWSPAQIHEAIDMAVREGGRQWLDFVEDETLILEEDKLIYALSSLAKKPHVVYQVWLEDNADSITGTASATGAVTYLIDTTAGFTDDEHNGKYISIYSGTGTGQLRTISDTEASTGKITPSVVFATAPDSTSKYRIWDSTSQKVNWIPLSKVDFTPWEYPDYMRLGWDNTGHYGFRIRLLYAHRPEVLASDTDTTVVPEEYLVYKVMALLHEAKTEGSKTDSGRHLQLAEMHNDRAMRYMMENPGRHPPMTIWGEVSGKIYGNYEDPLGWRG